jgi:3-phenylpropionate/trans-cinnamate dioxygenase ferredoxin subunit
LIMAGFVKVAATTDIPSGELRSYRVGHTRVVICNTGESYHALADECSHDSAPISDGDLAGDNIVCPRHGAKFNIHTGAVTGPPAVIGIDKYELKIEGQDILIRID